VLAVMCIKRASHYIHVLL